MVINQLDEWLCIYIHSISEQTRMFGLLHTKLVHNETIGLLWIRQVFLMSKMLSNFIQISNNKSISGIIPKPQIQRNHLQKMLQDQQELPPLVPIKGIHVQTQKIEPSKGSGFTPSHRKDLITDGLFTQNSPFTKMMKSIHKKSQDQTIVNKVKPQKTITVEKIEDLSRRFDEKTAFRNKQQDEHKKQVNQKLQEKSKTKYMVAEMLNKISLKNISQQLQPVSNEYINGKIQQIQKQLNELYLEAEKKEQSILKNQNNRHLKKQLTSIRNSIDHCTIIKELYYEKINFRNKITILERTILQLKKEKSQMQMEFRKRKEAAQSHALNMPCQRQRELEKELRLLQIKYQEEQKMKRELESNISETINTFKRLYEEADTARMIVISKLKDIQLRQKKCNQMISELQSQNTSSLRQANPAINSGTQTNRKNTQGQRQSERSERQLQEMRINRNRQREQRNYKLNQFKLPTHDEQARNELTPRKRKKSRKIQKQEERVQQKRMTLQEQIKKMRGNQSIVVNSIKKF